MECGRIVDLRITIDGLILKKNESIDDFIDNLNINSIYPVVYEVLYVEFMEESDG